MSDSLLIRGAEVHGSICDLRIEGECIAALAAQLARRPDEPEVDASGGALLPGLRDHHIHLFALAAAQHSVQCGPPQVHDHHELAAALASAALRAQSGTRWLRAVGYHESVAGELHCAELDALAPDLPLRLQHRSGKLWMLNSRAIEQLALQRYAERTGVETDAAGRVTGRLWRADAFLRERLAAGGDATGFPDLRSTSTQLLRCGISGLTDTSAHNGPTEYAAFVDAIESGALQQRLHLLGDERLLPSPHARIRRGPLKILLDEDELPDLATLTRRIEAAHAGGRAVAVHCVTAAELLFALAAQTDAGARVGDRIEHASVLPDAVLPLLRASGMQVVTQPNFVHGRGDRYLAEHPPSEHGTLYRVASLLRHGIPVGGGSDAPYGAPDPWAAMRAAVDRRTAQGACLGTDEAITPEQALALFCGPSDMPGSRAPVMTVGTVADLCLLDRPWASARLRLRVEDVAATFVAGRLCWQR